MEGQSVSKATWIPGTRCEYVLPVLSSGFSLLALCCEFNKFYWNFLVDCKDRISPKYWIGSTDGFDIIWYFSDIMAKHGGGAVDAAIAIMFCLGVVNPMMSGIGGGHFMTVYNKWVPTHWIGSWSVHTQHNLSYILLEVNKIALWINVYADETLLVMWSTKSIPQEGSMTITTR